MKYTLLCLPILLIQLYACPPQFKGNYGKYTSKGLKTYLKNCKKCHQQILVFGKRHTYNEWGNIFKKNINEVIKVHNKTEKHTYFDSKKFRNRSIFLMQALQDYSKYSQEIIILPSFLKPSCLKGNYSACLDLGESYRTGMNNATGLKCKMDKEESKKYFSLGVNILEKKCLDKTNTLNSKFGTAKKINACNKLSTIYKQGIAVSKNLKESKKYTDKSNELFINECLNSKASACNTLGMKYKLGIGVSKNIIEAKRFYQLGCTQGHKKSCTEADKL